jgi:subtilase family serine protease
MARQHRLFARMTKHDITLVAASGDEGSAEFTCDGSSYFKAVTTPASDPNVTAVGGTTLDADGSSGAYHSETTWNNSALLGDALASGGGVSVVYKRPRYQKGASNEKMRTLPDVSYTADFESGVVVVFGGALYSFGGTSVGTPQWAALVAIADGIAGERLGNVNDTLYALARRTGYFHDIRDGSTNAIPDLGCCGTPIEGFAAANGYDLATGLGSPIANTLVPALAEHD